MSEPLLCNFTLVCVLSIDGSLAGFVDGLVELIADQQAFVLDAVANQRSGADDAAVDELGEADQLAKLALEVESVTLIGYEIKAALAGIDKFEELVYVDIIQCPYSTHY